jgi:acetyl-CoA acetyltransferase
MGNTAENIVRQYRIGREAQDDFALRSHQKASDAARSGRFDNEIVAVEVPSRKQTMSVAMDEYIRHDASIEAMAKLNPAFINDGTVTAGNSSGVNDGAVERV